jgi:DNA-binding CsgD family transcriptional regulator
MIRRNKYIILYGAGLALLLILLKWIEWRFLIFDHAIEIYSGAIAILFTGLGIWLALKLARPKVKVVTVTLPPTENAANTNGPAATNAAPTNALDTNALAANAAAPNATHPDPKAIEKLGLSTRELEVLQGMAEGLSNQEIAGRLFVSLNTIKTHSSRIFEKLDVRRRTQAIEKARRLRVISDAPKA